MEQQANTTVPMAPTTTTDNTVTIAILATGGRIHVKDIIDLAGSMPRDGKVAFVIIGQTSDSDMEKLRGELGDVKRADDISQAIGQCTTRWMMFSDSTSRLQAGAIERLVGKADEQQAGVAVSGLDKPDEGIFTLHGKLFSTSALQSVKVSEDDICSDGYITLQHVMMKAGKVAGIGENLMAKIDLTKMKQQVTPAHRELLYRMTTLYCEIQLCDRCNLDCAYCSHLSPVSKPVTISLETLEAECRRLARIGMDEVNLMGGEPLLHPQVIEAIRLTRSILPNIKLIISTNGLLLPRMSREFWQTCRECKVVIRITPYPRAEKGTWNYFKYIWLIKKNRVSMESTGWRFGFRHQLLSEKADYDAIGNYLRCQLHCTQVRDATMWPCAYVAYSFNLNNKFGTNFKASPADRLPLTDDTTATDLRLWLLRTKPFCAHCGIKDAKHVNWRRTQYTRDEWLKE